jgi:hypothetical protein
MSDETKTFHLGDILSITTGCLVSPRHIGGVYDILGWMTGESLMTHQVPRACGECEGPLLAQHPDLAAIVTPETFGDDPERGVADWLTAQVAVYGETREVAPLAAEDHTYIDPITELRAMNPDAEVIVITAPDEADYEASYGNLTGPQQAEFGRLMSIPTDQWPPELIQHVRDTGGPFSGDALADAVAGWVRRQQS